MQIYFEGGKKWVRIDNIAIEYNEVKGIFNSMYPRYVKTFKASDDEIAKGFDEYIKVFDGLVDGLTTDEISGVYVLYKLTSGLFREFELLSQHRRIIRREHTELEWKIKLMEFNQRCAYCGTTGKMTKDHITPVSRGGSDKIFNIVPACQKCNSSKRDGDTPKWLSK